MFSLKYRNQPKCPVMSKLVEALLRIFSLPLVEGSFNIMGDRTALTVENDAAVSAINYNLRAKSKTGVEMHVTSEEAQLPDLIQHLHKLFFKSKWKERNKRKGSD